jgi:hypothetical protein
VAWTGSTALESERLERQRSIGQSRPTNFTDVLNGIGRVARATSEGPATIGHKAPFNL